MMNKLLSNSRQKRYILDKHTTNDPNGNMQQKQVAALQTFHSSIVSYLFKLIDDQSVCYICRIAQNIQMEYLKANAIE